MSNLFSDLKSILHLILVSKNVLLRKVFIFLDLLSLTFVSQVYINVRDWKSFQTPILKLLELFGRWKFDRLCILSYYLISEDILAVLPPLSVKNLVLCVEKWFFYYWITGFHFSVSLEAIIKESNSKLSIKQETWVPK